MSKENENSDWIDKQTVLKKANSWEEPSRRRWGGEPCSQGHGWAERTRAARYNSNDWANSDCTENLTMDNL